MGLITIEKEVFEKSWTGEIDQILSYDTEKGQFTVIRVSTREVRTHMTSLDAVKLSFSVNSKFNKTDHELIKYLYGLGVKSITRIPESLLNELTNNAEHVDKLLNVLREIESGDRIVQTQVWDDDPKKMLFIKDDDHELSSLCCISLIGGDGRNNYEAIAKLKKAGFKVFALEQDSCGWLVGGVQTSKGVISYG